MTIVAGPELSPWRRERGLAGSIKRDDFAVNYGVTRQFSDTLHHGRKPAGEILLVARSELSGAPCLVADRAETVELQLIAPFGTFRQRLGLLAEHGFK
jgi:hypothetical protein